MKFRWVPWYNETIITTQSNFEVLGRLRKAIGDDNWEIFSSSIYAGYVYNNNFEIFFRNPFALTKEMGSISLTVLLGDVVKTENGCVVKFSIILNWFLYLILVPFVALPFIFGLIGLHWQLIMISLVLYTLFILSWNLHAYNLCRFVKNVINTIPTIQS